MDIARLIPNSRMHTSRPGAPLPIRVAFAERAFAAGLKDKTVERVIDVVSRTDCAGVTACGRSYLLPLSAEEILRSKEVTFSALKLKLVTNRGLPPTMKPYISGPSEQISQPTFRLDIESPGVVKVNTARAHPIGGGYLFEAINEFSTMTTAFDLGIPTGFPIAVGQFTDLTFAGELVGFVVMAITNQQDERVGFRIFNKLEGAVSLTGQKQHQAIREALQDLCLSAYRSAQLLRRLHRAGLIHSHPSLFNFEVRDRNSIGITDFTNAKTISDMSEEEFIFRVFNDFRHLYLGVYTTASQAGLLPHQVKLLFQAWQLEDPFQGAFGGTSTKGYFSQDDVRLIGAGRLRAAMAVENFIPAIHRFWDPQTLDGQQITGIRNKAFQIISQIAQREYQRLTTSVG